MQTLVIAACMWLNTTSYYECDSALPLYNLPTPPSPVIFIQEKQSLPPISVSYSLSVQGYSLYEYREQMDQGDWFVRERRNKILKNMDVSLGIKIKF